MLPSPESPPALIFLLEMKLNFCGKNKFCDDGQQASRPTEAPGSHRCSIIAPEQPLILSFPWGMNLPFFCLGLAGLTGNGHFRVFLALGLALQTLIVWHNKIGYKCAALEELQNVKDTDFSVYTEFIFTVYTVFEQMITYRDVIIPHPYQ